MCSAEPVARLPADAPNEPPQMTRMGQLLFAVAAGLKNVARTKSTDFPRSVASSSRYVLLSVAERVESTSLKNKSHQYVTWWARQGLNL
jgi:hypothetical protein